MSNVTNSISQVLKSSGTRASAAPLQALQSSTGTATGASAGLTSLEDALAQNSRQAADLRAAVQAQINALTANTTAVSQSGGGQGGGSGAADAAKHVASTVANTVLGGFTLAPIVKGIMSLFGGDSTPAPPPPLPRYTAPASVQAEAGLVSGSAGPVAIDYGQNGSPRAVQAAPAQVTVNVQAMDSRSFLDRSEDIARAVRRAMLESSALNDVVSEL